MRGMEVLVELDARDRAPLARLNPIHRHYLARLDDNGVITLHPLEVVPAVAGSRPTRIAPPARPPRTDPASVTATIRDLHRRLREAAETPNDPTIPTNRKASA